MGWCQGWINFNIMGIHWKIQFLEGRLDSNKVTYRGELSKKREEACTVCRFKEGGFGKKEGVLIPQCTLW